MKITDPNCAIFTSENSLLTAPRAGLWFIRLGLSASLSLILLVASQKVGMAAAGDLDPTFGIGGKVTTDLKRSTDIANAVAVQADGKLVVVGQTYQNNDYTGEDFVVARYNTDGTLDTTFGARGRVRTDFPGLAAVPSSVVIQPDGKIVVAGGAFPLFTFAGDFKVARYNPNGSLDTSFGSGGIVTTFFPGDGSYAFALALQSDGKIIAAGTDFVDFNPGDMSDTDFALARYNPDGSLDTTFGNGGTVTTDFFGTEDDAAVRYLSNGTIDTTFGAGGKVSTDFGDRGFDRAHSAALQADGKIVAAGFATSVDGISENFAVARYTSSGVLDTTFNNGGLKQIDFGSCCQSAYKVLLQSDGKIITVGFPNSESSDSDFLLARLNSTGSLDTTFGIGGKVRTSFGNLNGGAQGGLLQADGKIVAVGFQATSGRGGVDFALARYLSQ
jgi:uncharacterized delta-60 repeat protein